MIIHHTPYLPTPCYDQFSLLNAFLRHVPLNWQRHRVQLVPGVQDTPSPRNTARRGPPNDKHTTITYLCEVVYHDLKCNSHTLKLNPMQGCKWLQSLVNSGALSPVATERRRNTPKRGGATDASTMNQRTIRVIRGGICHGCGAWWLSSQSQCTSHDAFTPSGNMVFTRKAFRDASFGARNLCPGHPKRWYANVRRDSAFG